MNVGIYNVYIILGYKDNLKIFDSVLEFKYVCK